MLLVQNQLQLYNVTLARIRPHRPKSQPLSYAAKSYSAPIKICNPLKGAPVQEHAPLTNIN